MHIHIYLYRYIYTDIYIYVYTFLKKLYMFYIIAFLFAWRSAEEAVARRFTPGDETSSNDNVCSIVRFSDRAVGITFVDFSGFVKT